MTYINLNLGDNLFLREFLVTKYAFFALYYFRENETGFEQDNNMIFEILLFCSSFAFIFFLVFDVIFISIDMLEKTHWFTLHANYTCAFKSHFKITVIILIAIFTWVVI